MELILTARPPFSLHSVVYSHGWVQLAPFRALEPTPRFSYICRLSTGRVLEFTADEAAGGVGITSEEALEPDERQELTGLVTWMLALHQDLTPFYAQAQLEPKLAQMVEHAQGRVLRSATLFEDVVKTILTTNTQWGGTKRMVAALIDLYGDPLPAEPNRRAFPTPARLAALDLESLASARLGYRAPYILDLARVINSGKLDLEALKDTDLSTPELRKLLLGIKGVGGYAAANLLMMVGRYDAIPIDSWAMKMVSQEWYGGAPVGPTEVEAAFTRWGEWKGLAYWFWNWTNGS